MIGAIADVLSNWRRGREDRRWFADFKRNRDRLRKNAARLIQEITMQDHDRKDHPVATGLVDYFPDALLAIAAVSMEGARKHDTFGPDGRPTWDRTKSTDDADALMRHFIDRGSFDTDGHSHSAKVAWRALAVLQRELDAAAEYAAVDGDDYALKGDGTTAKMAAVDAAGDAWTKHVNDMWGFDLGKPGGDKGVYFVLDSSGKVVASSDKPMSLDEILKAAKAPFPPAPEPKPDSSLKQYEGLTEVEQFATWLTTRQACVHVGAKHAVYGMFEAVEEWYRDHPRTPQPIETFESWLDRRLGHVGAAARDHYTVTQEYLLWAESLRK